MQDSLFDAPASPTPRRRADAAGVAAAPARPAHKALAARLPATLRLGTSSWTFPGWGGLVWDGQPSETLLARRGLPAYAAHPLLRTVSLDRAFYRPLGLADYAALAAQVPADFRFVVKAPSLVCDALVRDAAGRATQPNPAFLDPALAVSQFAAPAIDGLGDRLGALVFQLSPLPPDWKRRMPELLDRLAAMLAALPPAGSAVVAVEVRDTDWLVPAFAAALRAAGATYCLGGHPRLPGFEQQLPLLRALWPGPLVCRWNLHRRHGAHGYGQAKAGYAPFDRLVDPDPDSRAVLARVAAATDAAGHAVLVTVNNKAEGSAPASVVALAEAIVERLASGNP